MIRRSLRQRRHPTAEELAITPLMNLVVTLIPFLLSVVVFSRLAAIPVSSASTGATAAMPPPVAGLDLRVSIGEDTIEVQTVAGRVRLPVVDGRPDLGGLSRLIRRLKDAAPDEQRAVIIPGPDTPYGLLVGVMDRVRIDMRAQPPRLLFPEIAIGVRREAGP